MDETEERKDTSERDSSGEQKGTSTDTKTHTAESEKKAVDDALSAAGRDAKTLSGKTAEADRILTDAKKMQTDLKAEREQWQKDRDIAEQESAGEDQDALKSVQERQRQRAKETELAQRKRELDEKELKITEAQKEVAESTKERNAREIATRLNVDYESLMKFTDGSKEAMEELAKQLSEKEAKPPLKTDSSTTIGGGEMPESAKDKMRAGFDELHK